MDVAAHSADPDSLRKQCAQALHNDRLEEAGALLEDLHALGQSEARLSAALAKKFAARSDHASALPFALRAWRADEGNVGLLVDYARALRRADLNDQAIEIMARAAQTDASRADIKKGLCAWLAQAGRLEEAEAVAVELTRLEPASADNVNLRINLLRQLGRHDEAIGALRALTVLPHATLDDFLRLHSLLMAKGAREEALALASEVAERWPEDAEAQKRASALCVRAGRDQDALKFASQAVGANLDDAAAWLRLQSLLVARDASEEAADIAAEIAERWPEDADAQLRASTLCKRVGRSDEALAFARRAVAANLNDAAVWLRLQSLLIASDAPEEAADIAAEIAGRWPEDAEAQLRAASFCTRVGRSDDALAFARQAIAASPENAEAHRRLSLALGAVRQAAEAFEHASIAVQLAPENADYRIFLANHYRRMGRLSDAATELSLALLFNPDNRKALLDYIELLKDRGQDAKSELVRRRAHALFPDDPSFAIIECDGDGEATSEAGADAPEASDSAPADLTALLARRRPRRPPPTTTLGHARDAIKVEARVIWALMLREVQMRYLRSPFGFVWAILQPVIHLGILGLSMYVLGRLQAPLGDYFIVFHVSAVVPYLTLLHVNTLLTVAGRKQVLLRMPLVKMNDILIAIAVPEFIIGIMINILLLFGFYLAGYQWLPADPITMVEALFFVWLFAFGLGTTNCMITARFEIWEHVSTIQTRILYFISGIFYLPTMVPPDYLRYLIWNPLLHGIDWNREGFYDDYHGYYLSRSYLVGCAVVSVVVGLVLERVMRKDLLEYR